MRITPWMLTMTTFVMVGAIAVMYLFKPPQRVPTGTLPPGTSFTNAKTFAQPAVASQTPIAPIADVKPSTKGNPITAEAKAAVANEDEQPYTPLPPVGDNLAELASDESATTEPPESIDPIDSMFEGQAEPVQPSFVTQQFRGGQRIDVTFRDGERIEVPRVSSMTGTRRAN